MSSNITVKPATTPAGEPARAFLIRDALRSAGVSLAAVAEAAGVSPQAVAAAFGRGVLSARIEEAATSLLCAEGRDDLGTLSFAGDLLEVAEEAADRGHADRALRAFAAAWTLLEEVTASG